MLTGKELGSAIRTAIAKKGVAKKAVAAHFGVSPPSIQDWMNRGTIGKDKLPGLWAYFADVVGPEHWGLQELAGTIPSGNLGGFAAANPPTPLRPRLSTRELVLQLRVAMLAVGRHQRLAVVSNLSALVDNIEDEAQAVHIAELIEMTLAPPPARDADASFANSP